MKPHYNYISYEDNSAEIFLHKYKVVIFPTTHKRKATPRINLLSSYYLW